MPTLDWRFITQAGRSNTEQEAERESKTAMESRKPGPRIAKAALKLSQWRDGYYVLCISDFDGEKEYFS